MALGERALEGPSANLAILIREISDLLSVLGNPHRLCILFLLSREPSSFHALLIETGLKKSALANQLNLLQKGGLIEKVAHGSYKISETGIMYLEALLDARKKTVEKTRFADEWRQREEVARAFLERK